MIMIIVIIIIINYEMQYSIQLAVGTLETIQSLIIHSEGQFDGLKLQNP